MNETEFEAPCSTRPSALCRICGEALTSRFADLGKSPLCETYLAPKELNRAEPFYPLHVWVCDRCFLVQLEEYVEPAEIFSDYPYFSSFSSTWVEHAAEYAGRMTDRLELDGGGRVVEIGSNDGYLLQHFAHRGIGVLGVEPAANVAAAAEERGVPTRVAFFGERLAAEMAGEGVHADLIAANNVLAQIPDLHDVAAGLRILLAPQGVATIEFPHLLETVRGNQFDQIYHEHFSYFSLTALRHLFERHGLTAVEVERLPTHGGSLRVYVVHEEAAPAWRPVHTSAAELLALEKAEGMTDPAWYAAFQPRVEATKRRLLRFLIDAKERGRSVVGYGAPGKGNTLLNYCGIRTDLLEYTVDLNPVKQGRFTPGTHIPIHAPGRIDETRPDDILVLPWNLAEEIMGQMSHVGAWGTRFVVPIPDFRIVEVAPVRS